MTAVLESLAGLKEQRVAEYHALVDDVIAGKEVPADQIELACIRAGREPREFASVVRKRQERAKERERLEELPNVRQKLADADARIVANNETFEAARLAHLQTAWSLDASRNELIAQLTDLNGLKERLVKECRVHELDERCGAINAYLDGLRRQRREAVRQLEDQQARLRDVSRGQVERWWISRDARSQPLPSDVDDGDPLAIYKRRVLRAAAVVDDIDRREGEYLQEQADIREKQFQW